MYSVLSGSVEEVDDGEDGIPGGLVVTPEQ